MVLGEGRKGRGSQNRVTGMKWAGALFIPSLHSTLKTCRRPAIETNLYQKSLMRRYIQGGNFPLCPGLPQDVVKGGGARWRVERRWWQGMSHVKWKIWKMSPRWNVENVSRGEFLRQGGVRWQGALTDITPPWVFRVDTVGEVWTTLQLWLHITTVFLLLQISSYYLTFAGQCSKRFQQSTFWWIHINMNCICLLGMFVGSSNHVEICFEEYLDDRHRCNLFPQKTGVLLVYRHRVQTYTQFQVRWHNYIFLCYTFLYHHQMCQDNAPNHLQDCVLSLD